MSHHVAIVGTREPTAEQREAVAALVDSLPIGLPIGEGIIVLSGGARGVDRWAIACARRRGLATAEFHAKWKEFGKAAGFMRNQLIVDYADEVHAFPGAGNGTRDTIAKAKKAGKKVTVHE